MCGWVICDIPLTGEDGMPEEGVQFEKLRILKELNKTKDCNT